MRQRALEATGVESGPISPCAVRGCPNRPSERKPYCEDHVQKMPYAGTLLAELKVRAAEDAGQSPFTSKSSRVREALDLLALKGEQSPEQLAVEIGLGAKAMARLLEALEETGLVRVERWWDARKRQKAILYLVRR